MERPRHPGKEFNWFEDTAEFGFEDIEDAAPATRWAKTISKKATTISLVVLGTSLGLLLVQAFLPESLRHIGDYSLKHVALLTGILSFLFLVTKMFVHCAFVLIKDNLTNNKLLHNRTFRLEMTIGLWALLLLPIGIKLRRRISWSKTFIERLFVCVFITDLALILKSISVEMFKIYFLSTSLKKKAKDIEIKEKIINSMRSFCYGDVEEPTVNTFVPCLMANCLNDSDEDSEDPNANIGMEFIHGDVGTVIGDIFTTSLFQKSHLSQREIMCLARDVFAKCSADKEVVTFNDFCEIFYSPQEAIQAFLYFDTSDVKQITRKDLRDTLISFHYDRKNLNTTYNSLSNFIRVIDNLATIIVLIPLVFLYLITFRVPIKQIITLSLSSALVLNFLVSGILKDFYLNVSFILTHPFDIGDEVIIDGRDYVVYRISLYNTDMLGADGGKITFLNKVLCTKNVVNMSRAPQKLIQISFTLDPAITADQFKTVKKELLIYLRNKEETFYESFTIQSETESSCHLENLKCMLIARCKTLGNRMSKLQLKIELISQFKDILSRTMTPPPPPSPPAEQ